MSTPKILRYLGLVIIIILLLIDVTGKIQLPLLVVGLCIGAIISIVGLVLERRDTK